ncbi:hypothetical protein ACOSP7_011540 [Xanthoceras sorbifolium]|uniref:Transcription factor TCP2-like n=1 Tax=Xanthoceras sorbifolium TaxID=99658 RepID=A0ABQ8HW06_9ROSI|nr:hypothetical protein JRO89_XS06G0013800 [Xanthoceras sorbifolium]
MEVEEIQTQACKFPRIGNGRLDSTKLLAQKDQYPDEEEDHRDQHLKRAAAAASTTSVGGLGVDNGGGGGANRLRGWHHSSRIIRVSRASGGKDRHSKVWTSKGLRDRRVRLSVTTAIQFYDLQDRLGYDQPSKAVEWLIKAAADSIAELPSLNSPFPDTPKQLSDEKRASEGTDQQGFDSVELDADPNYQHNQSQHQRSLTKSACSSTSETSKGSGLSLSRSDQRVNRVKARERARVRAKEKEKDNDSSRIAHPHHHHHNVNHISQSSSFTELLTGGIGSVNNNNHSNNSNNNNNTTSPNGSSPHHQNPNGEPIFFQKATTAARSWPATPMDYFNTGLLGPSSSRPHHFPGQIQLGNSNSLPQTMSIPPFSVSNENHHQEMQHFSFVPDHLIPVATTQPGPGGDYNLNFTISPSLAGFNRGTLQSNSSSPSLLPQIQRFGSSSPLEGSNLPFYIAAPQPVENHHNHHHHHHQFPAGFDGRLHLYHGDGSRHSDQKGKGKN